VGTGQPGAALAQATRSPGSGAPLAGHDWAVLAHLSRISSHPKKKERVARPSPVQGVHERWQMDWKVGITIGGGQIVQLATVRDPFGAAFIALEFYPVSGPKARIAEARVRSTLRQSFVEWGLPDEIQTDGEPTLNATASDGFPSRFQLWLAGLGVRHRRIRPGVATDDAEVERGHRTVCEYVLEGQTEQTLEPLQQALELARAELNGEYPSRAHGCDGRPPLQAHPELRQPKRPFRRDQEAQQFELQRVDAYLANLQWERKVGKTGQITLGGAHQSYSLGRQFWGQTVTVHFDPQDRQFVAVLPHEGPHQEAREVKRWPAKSLSAQEILDLPEGT